MNSDFHDNWLSDVEAANQRALFEWETVLDRLEVMLNGPWNRSADSVKESSVHWTAAIQAAGTASRRLASGLKTAESRYNDARLAGLSAGPDSLILERARIAGQRSSHLGLLLRDRMNLLSSDLKNRRRRRPNNRVFAGNIPSLVDMHV